MCDFSDLPVELKQHVLSYLSWRDILSAVSRVSKEVREIGLGSIEEVNLETTIKMNRHRLLPLLSPRTKILTLSREEEVAASSSPDLILQALRRCPNLTALSVFSSDWDGATPTPDIFLALENHGRSLRCIRLSQIDFAGSSSLAWARYLTSIGLTYCRGLDDHALAEIGLHCQGLASFDCRISSQPQYSDVGMCTFLNGVRETIKKLEFRGDTFSDASFKKLGDCSLLEYLYISEAPKLEVGGLRSITGLTRMRSLIITSQGTPNSILSDDNFKSAFDGEKEKILEVLILSGMKGLGDVGLAAIARSCPGLTRLGIYSNSVLPITDIGARAVVKNCRKLRHLTLDRSESVSKDAFGSSGRSALNSLPDLKYLDFSGMDQKFKEELDSLGIITT